MWDALGLMSSSFRMCGLFLEQQTEMSLVKRSRQVQAIQGHASFQLRGSEQGRQPMERALSCSLLLACVFCHHLLEPHGQQLSRSLSPFPKALQSFPHVENKLFWALADLKPSSHVQGHTPFCSFHITKLGK